MSDWKDLDIGNIPSDFFVNKRYEIQQLNQSYGDNVGGWSNCSAVVLRVTIVNLLNRKEVKYRYRLKPLDPIRIDKEFNDLLKRSRHMHGIFMNSKLSYSFSDEVGLIMFNDRPVEIIEE